MVAMGNESWPTWVAIAVGLALALSGEGPREGEFVGERDGDEYGDVRRSGPSGGGETLLVLYSSSFFVMKLSYPSHENFRDSRMPRALAAEGLKIWESRFDTGEREHETEARPRSVKSGSFIFSSI